MRVRDLLRSRPFSGYNPVLVIAATFLAGAVTAAVLLTWLGAR